MIRYESITVQVDSQQEAFETILTVPEGKKITVIAISPGSATDVIGIVEIEGVRLSEIDLGSQPPAGSFYPLNIEVEGPKEIKVGYYNGSGVFRNMDSVLMYEE